MITIKEKYKALGSESRYYIVSGGRGSGKSYSVNLFLLLLTYETGHVILFTRYTLTSAHVSIIPEFIDKIQTSKLEQDFYITKDEIINLRTGSKILFRGIKTSSGTQTANLKSLSGVTTWVLDEAEELVDEEIFDKIDLSIRHQSIQNRVVLILNPATKEHFIYNKFFESKGVAEGSNITSGDTTYIHTTYLDNKENLSQSFIDQIERMKEQNPKKFQHVVLGGWLDKADGVVFTNWRFGEFNPDALQTSFGQDYGYSIDPTTLTEVAIDRKQKKIYVKECFYKTKLITSEIADLNTLYAIKKLIIGDNSEGRLIDELRRLGNNIVRCDKPPIEFGVSLMQDYEIIVEPNSTNIAKELNNYIYLDKGSKLYLDAYNHAIDGIRYNVVYHLGSSFGIDIR